MKVRFFGGFDFESSYDSSTFVQEGYAKGVPMGGDLLKTNEKSPQFIVWAMKDPMGPGLDRIQIIKGWLENGEMKEAIYNVAVSDDRTIQSDGSVEPVKATVNLETGDFDSSKGSSE
jgi:hypothetical protein